MSKKPSESVVLAWIALMRAQQVALLHIEKTFKDAGLPSLSVYDALWELDKAGDAGLRPFELGRQMLVTQWNMSRLIERLVQNGLATRDACEDDGRGNRIAITRAGKDLRKRMWAVYAPAISEALGLDLSDRDADTLARLLQPIGSAPP
jgi:DNA-binding MarR family transcriptional regulator